MTLFGDRKFAMVVLWLLLMMAATVTSAKPVTVYAVRIIMNSGDISESCRIDNAIVSDFLQRLQRLPGLAVEAKLFQASASGDNWAKFSNIQSYWNEINGQITADDVLFVYFTGHGGIKNNQTFLKLVDCDKNISDWYQLFSYSQARLCLIISDCCSRNQQVAQQGAEVRGKGASEDSDDYMLEKLFRYTHGTVRLVSSQEGEYSFGHSRIGGFFTRATFDYAYQRLKREQEYLWTWQNYFTIAQDETQLIFSQIFPNGFCNIRGSQKKQTPRCDVCDTRTAVIPAPGIDGCLNINFQQDQHRFDNYWRRLNRLYRITGAKVSLTSLNANACIGEKIRTLWHDIARLSHCLGIEQLEQEYQLKGVVQLGLNGKHFEQLSKIADWSVINARILDLEKVIGVQCP